LKKSSEHVMAEVNLVIDRLFLAKGLEDGGFMDLDDETLKAVMQYLEMDEVNVTGL
jgi:hypothetical protein